MLTVKRNELAEYTGQRKHSSQMKGFEVNGLFRRLKAVKEDDWYIGGHALQRLEEKRIRAVRKDITSTIHHAELVEYKIDYNQKFDKYDERVVLRSKAIVNRCYNLNVVYSLTNKRIVTVWINHINDRHSTLDWSIYNADMKVFGV